MSGISLNCYAMTKNEMQARINKIDGDLLFLEKKRIELRRGVPCYIHDAEPLIKQDLQKERRHLEFTLEKLQLQGTDGSTNVGAALLSSNAKEVKELNDLEDKPEHGSIDVGTALLSTNTKEVMVTKSNFSRFKKLLIGTGIISLGLLAYKLYVDRAKSSEKL